MFSKPLFLTWYLCGLYQIDMWHTHTCTHTHTHARAHTLTTQYSNYTDIIVWTAISSFHCNKNMCVEVTAVHSNNLRTPGIRKYINLINILLVWEVTRYVVIPVYKSNKCFASIERGSNWLLIYDMTSCEPVPRTGVSNNAYTCLCILSNSVLGKFGFYNRLGESLFHEQEFQISYYIGCA